MSAIYITVQESEIPDPPVGTVQHISTDRRMLIRLSEGAVAPDGVATMNRSEAESMLDNDIKWQSPAMPWNI